MILTKFHVDNNPAAQTGLFVTIFRKPTDNRDMEKNAMKRLMPLVMTLWTATMITAGCTGKPASDENEITLRSPSGSAVVSLDGGRVISWKNAEGEELFFMPAKPNSPDGDWSHGGTSLCWPWFGPNGPDKKLIHGFARNRRFTVRDRRRIDGGESVILGFKTAANANPRFPHDTDVELSVSLTDRLTLKLRTVNLGTRPIDVTAGLQSYFPVSGYGGVSFRGVTAEDFSAVDGMDKAFKRRSDTFGFKDSGSGRSFTFTASGNSGIVVWTPGTVEPANRNLAVDDCPKFIVIGPSCRAAEGALTVRPGESREISFGMSVN